MSVVYSSDNCVPAYQLNWSLSLFRSCPWCSRFDWLNDLKVQTEADGVRILEYHARNACTDQFLLSTKPVLAPAAIIRSVKGRLQYLVRGFQPKAFARNYRIVSVGSARQTSIERYGESQIEHHHPGDSHADASLSPLQFCDPSVDLARVRKSGHGEFIHNLHVVMVHRERPYARYSDVIPNVRDGILRHGRESGHLLSRAGILGDHIHLTLGCLVTESPAEVALGYMNSLAEVWNGVAVYRDSYYVGTFGPYDLGAIRNNLQRL